ncbi:MAG: DNA-binding protein [Blastococcus sp.]|nr:DNA-binding protein [Blastococcus sp.]
MVTPEIPGPWRGSVLRLPGGQVLLGGSALLDVVRALQAAQRVTQRDGIAAPERWRGLLAQLLSAAADAPATAPPGSAAVPQPDHSSWLPGDLVDTKEAAEMLGCKPRNVRDLNARGALESGRLVGGRLLLERTEIEAELRRRAEARHNEEGRRAC